MRPAIEPSPQAHPGPRPEFEIAVERQFDRVSTGGDWRFLEPNTMLHAAQIQHGVPSIRTLSESTLAQAAEIQTDMGVGCDEPRGADRYNRRRGLGSPEDGLLEEGSFGVGCEKPTPNAGAICPPCFDPMVRCLDSFVRTRRYGAGIPTRSRSSPLSRSDRSKCRLTISS